ncbi:ferredoxin [candidate division MSBL1 archaeon SCGC-AAA259M10]|uniref:Ferredoxin n=3 Tax=candidate division MSBL1 TaxID=215777 RepID=A0A133U5B4_9EURY|nr:ferredoxin [candidate division MSBL1 archaeon SCGC-AAA259D14]KXA89645.1 ferredoxin [candidate division MSBL1 archaeon SCGC-AAA259B11]KXB00256.1 ferredoxin [candidate division MSBL1 archaeon SCGC-AAA259M10]
MATLLFKPGTVEGEFSKGTSLMEAAQDFDIEIESLCGGKGLCGRCKVIIEEGKEHIKSLTESEEYLLSGEEIEKNYRLSCMAKVGEEGFVQVRVPSESLRKGQIVLTEGREVKFEKNPSVKKYHLKIPRPTLKDTTADYERVKKHLKQRYKVNCHDIDYLVQKELPNLLRRKKGETKENWDVTVTLWDEKEIISVDPGMNENMFGLAVDVGTTTLAGYLMDLRTGETRAVSSSLNPQLEFGEDLMTRISYVIEKEDGRRKMQKKVIDEVNEIIDDLREEAGIDRDEIYETVLVGNTAMHHFFLGIDPAYLPRSPFIPARQASIKSKARELGVNINPSGSVYWLPVNGGWIGADNVAVMLATRIYDSPENSLVIDIGTNGEVAFGNEEKAYATSAAAGPALEGAQIKYGMRAQKGSIEKIKIDPESLEPTYRTIGDEPPVGICGSGIIDATAEMLKSGIIEKNGRFNEDKRKKNNRVRKSEDDLLEYVIAWSNECSIDTDITMTQRDIREIQKAKGAIQAAARVLMQKWGTEKIDQVLLAGAFGNYIDKESAMIIGLYPECDLEKVKSIGNAAGTGAKLSIMSKEKKKEAEKIPELVEFFEIAGTEEFRKNYMETMYLPHKNPELYPWVEKLIFY